MPARLVLLHSPLLGPLTWRRAAEVLRAHGHEADAPAWPRLSTLGEDCYAALAGSMAATIGRGADAIVVAHSGAGALMPSVAALAKGALKGVIYCDAILPHPGQSWIDTAPPNLAGQLLAGAVEGRLPSWDQWWPPGALERLAPDAAVREALISECEGLPLDFLEEPAPAMTLTGPAAYLQLSGAYDDEGQYAVRQGWPVVRLPLHHLAMLTHAEAVAGAIHGLAERLPHV